MGFNCSRPNVIGNPNGKPCVPGTFYNTCAFTSDLVQGTYGNEGRNIVRGPGYQNWDVSFFKVFRFASGCASSSEPTFFNIWNHTNFLTGPTGSDGQFEPVAVELGTSQMGFPQVGARSSIHSVCFEVSLLGARFRIICELEAKSR